MIHQTSDRRRLNVGASCPPSVTQTANAGSRSAQNASVEYGFASSA